MANEQHKGTELNNVNETWNENERNLASQENNSAPEIPDTASDSDLDQLVKSEAAEYDNANKDDRKLGGERATVNDDDDV